MPMDKSRYPVNWDEISLRIREKAQWKCEQCGVAHDAIIVRSRADAARFIVWNPDTLGYDHPDGRAIRLSEIPEEFDTSGAHARIVLTVHHIGVAKPDGTPGDIHDKMDCRDENLTALCQRCHFIADLPSHIISARASRLKKKQQRIAESGQLSFEVKS